MDLQLCGSSSGDASRSRQQPCSAQIELPALIGLGIKQGLGIDIGCGDGKLTESRLTPPTARKNLQFARPRSEVQ
jgi:hypothetical protein